MTLKTQVRLGKRMLTVREKHLSRFSLVVEHFFRNEESGVRFPHPAHEQM